MVIEREREIRGLSEQLREANERHDRSIASLEAVSLRLEEIQAQARGQATRIRMKALREAVEVSRRVQELAGGWPPRRRARSEQAAEPRAANGTATPPRSSRSELFEGRSRSRSARSATSPSWSASRTRPASLGASEISVERFSEGRATLSMRLDEPVELLRELEELSPLDFKVRHTADDNLSSTSTTSRARSSAPPERRPRHGNRSRRQSTGAYWRPPITNEAVAQLAERLRGTREAGGSSAARVSADHVEWAPTSSATLRLVMQRAPAERALRIPAHKPLARLLPP